MNTNLDLVGSTLVWIKITNAEIDAIRIRVGVQLVFQDSKGNVKGANVKFEVFIQQGNGPLESRDIIDIGGKFSTLKVIYYCACNRVD